jgi:hypothetical protein
MIRGRAYHPQSQGSIEIANGTLKKRLQDCMASSGRKDWAALLLDVAFELNTSSCSVLPGRKTPFDIWFGRQRYWITQEQLLDDDTEDDEDAVADGLEVQSEDGNADTGSTEATEPATAIEATQTVAEEVLIPDDEPEDDADDSSSVSSDGGFDISQHEAQVAEYNMHIHELMKRKGAATAKTFSNFEIATLFVPKKLRLNTEQCRIAVRILNSNSTGYQLLSRHGIIKGRFQGNVLNKITDDLIVDIIGSCVPIQPLMTDKGKPIIRTLAATVRLDHHRPSVAVTQRMGRSKKAPKRKPGKRSRRVQTPEPEFHGFASSPPASPSTSCTSSTLSSPPTLRSTTPDHLSDAPMSTPIRETTRIRRPSSKIQAQMDTMTQPITTTPTNSLLTPRPRGLRAAGKRAASAISELAATLPIPPKRRRK